MKVKIINRNIALSLLTLTIGGNLNCVTYADRVPERKNTPTKLERFMKRINDNKDLLERYKVYFSRPIPTEDSSESAVESDPESVSESESEFELEPESKPVSESESVSEFESDSDPESEPVSEFESNPEPESKFEPERESGLEPVLEPEPELTLEKQERIQGEIERFLASWGEIEDIARNYAEEKRSMKIKRIKKRRLESVASENESKKPKTAGERLKLKKETLNGTIKELIKDMQEREKMETYRKAQEEREFNENIKKYFSKSKEVISSLFNKFRPLINEYSREISNWNEVSTTSSTRKLFKILEGQKEKCVALVLGLPPDFWYDLNQFYEELKISQENSLVYGPPCANLSLENYLRSTHDISTHVRSCTHSIVLFNANFGKNDEAYYTNAILLVIDIILISKALNTLSCVV